MLRVCDKNVRNKYLMNLLLPLFTSTNYNFNKHLLLLLLLELNVLLLNLIRSVILDL